MLKEYYAVCNNIHYAGKLHFISEIYENSPVLGKFSRQRGKKWEKVGKS
jgi:hypothetical protein